MQIASAADSQLPCKTYAKHEQIKQDTTLQLGAVFTTEKLFIGFCRISSAGDGAAPPLENWRKGEISQERWKV